LFNQISSISKFAVAILIVGFAGGEAKASAPAHLQWIGAWEYDPVGFTSFANFGTTQNLHDVSHGAQLGMRHLIDLENILFVEHYDQTTGAWAGLTLRTDYQQSWKAFNDLITPYADAGNVIGFMMPDEALWRGISVSELEAASSAVKADFPNKSIYWNEAAPALTTNQNLLGEPVNLTQVPSAIDWVSLDWYLDPAATQNFYNQYLYPKMLPHQKAYLVPEAYSSDNHPSLSKAQLEAVMVSRAQTYWSWATTDTRIAGINPWHWKDQTGANGAFELGIENLSTLRDSYTAIGAQIEPNNPRLGSKTGFMPVQRFDTFTDMESLPSTYAWDPWAGLNGASHFPHPGPPPLSEAHFSSDEAASGSTSIRIESGGRMRYAWGTQARNHRLPTDIDDTVQYFDVMVKGDLGEMPRLTLIPYRERDIVLQLDFNEFGVFLTDATGYSQISGVSELDANVWNHVRLMVDIGINGVAGDGQISLWVNGSVLYSGGAPVDHIFTTVGLTSSNGVYLDDMAIFLEPMLEGDLDGDGFVGITDLNIVLSAWNQNVPPGNPLADPSNDGFVGIEDLNVVLGNWNAGTPPVTAVPEPAGLSLYCLIGILGLYRRP
jgi:hypothetical protein